jgi:hypothetical protein
MAPRLAATDADQPSRHTRYELYSKDHARDQAERHLLPEVGTTLEALAASDGNGVRAEGCG